MAKLEVRGLEAFYGDSQVLFGMDFELGAGEVISLLGRNGAGKSTCLKAIMGLLEKRRAKTLNFDQKNLLSLGPRQAARLGLAYCPDDRGIFASLSVTENLKISPALFPGAMTLEQVYALFPRLRERAKLPGKKISGGEQQMLAIARGLMTGSRFLLLDEPTEGLAPLVIQEIEKLLIKLKQEGYAILLVEQNHRFAKTVADRHYLVERGRVLRSFAARDFDLNQKEINHVLGLESL